jgi:hypothetical protein
MNLQRHNLPEIDKAEAIARWLQMLTGDTERSLSRNAAIDLIAARLGYSTDSILAFMRMVRMDQENTQ